MTTAAATNIVDAALDLIRKGVRVIPNHWVREDGPCSCNNPKCKSPGKHPIPARWPEVATTDEATIRAWWTKWPRANLGIVCGRESGIVFVDLDGAAGIAAFDEVLQANGNDAGHPWEEETGSGGRHLGYAYDDRCDALKNWVKADGLPIDIRTNGGNLVCAPSLHKSGKRYTWVNPPSDTPPSPMPQWLIDHLVANAKKSETPKSNGQPQTSYSSRATDAEEQHLIKCSRGWIRSQKTPLSVEGSDGSGAFFNVARHLFWDMAFDEHTARGLLDEYNATAQPRWEGKELEHKIADSCNPNGKPTPRGWKREEWLTKFRAERAASPRNGSTNSHARGEHHDEDDPASGGGKASDARHFPLTDLGNAQRFAHEHGAVIRYCHPWGKWLVWDGMRWRLDDTGAIMAFAKRTILGLFTWAQAMIERCKDDGSDEAKAALAKVKAVLDFALKSQHVNRLKAMIDLARSENGIPILPVQLDTDRRLLNCVNGTIDLRTGELRPHRQTDYITKLVPLSFDPAAQCPVFVATFNVILNRDDALAAYLRRFLGYSLTGETNEQVSPIAYGTGSNGKTLLFKTVLNVMGSDYAGTVPPELLIQTKSDQHPTIKADLHGKRLMIAPETGEGARLNEERLKALTGGDSVKARRCREDFWEFDATHKIILMTNHRPRVTGSDHGIWRRLSLLPFVVRFWDADKGETGPSELKADKELLTKLAAEAEGILAWLVRGCLEWQRHGLEAPEIVRVATSEYRTAEDRIGAFIAERCQLNREFRVRTGNLYKAFENWCEANGERGGSTRGFTLALEEREIMKDPGKRWYVGIDLAPEE